MNRGLAGVAILGIIAISIAPEYVFSGEVGRSFGGDVINTHADSLSQFLFGPVARIAATFGGAVGIIRGYLQQSVGQMLTFGGIILTSAVLPTFINSFYSMLLP
ncbi:MAG: hypothetical protein ACHQUC_02840 [Chlamydiales bacterium]